MDSETVTTSIDELVAYLKRHGETESAELAKAVKSDEKHIEEWVGALEKAGVVGVSYRMGRMYVRVLENGKAGERQ